MKRWILIAAILTQAAGCSREAQTSQWQRIRELQEEKTELSLQVERLQRDNIALTSQIQTLAALDADVRIAGLVVPQALRIGRHTGFYDKTKDGTRDSFIVYLEPVDAQQDVVKAAGAVDVELWDLTAAPQKARLGQWHIGAEELKTLWGRGLTGAYYRLTFPTDGIAIGNEKDWTVHVRFTDYLTGRVLTDQRVITR